MHVFLSEYLTCGALAGGSAKSSLAVEGAAMLRALAADAATVPGWTATVAWDAELPPLDVPGVEVALARSPAEELDLFRRHASAAEATLAIAPEFSGLLEGRCRTIAEVGGRSAGSSPEAIALCGDKLRLAEHFSRHGVPTVVTRVCDLAALADALSASPWDGFVVKPRFGAGSAALFRVRNRKELAVAREAYATDETFGEPILQPFVRGLSLSVAGIVSTSGVELFPVGRQAIVGDSRPHYAGGAIPAATGHDAEVADLARRTITAVPGLRGYVGVDLILPQTDDGFGPPTVVEVNPRPTTSYLGYQRLAAENLAGRVLDPETSRPPIRWRNGRVEFDPDGTARYTGGTP